MKGIWGTVALLAVAMCLGMGDAVAGSGIAAPEIVIFHGDLLPRRVAIVGFAENLRWISATIPLRPDQRPLRSTLDTQPSVEIALYWGAQWRPYAHPESLRSLSLERANQRGRLYPAILPRQPLVDIGGLRSLTDSAVMRLRAHGIPVDRPRPQWKFRRRLPDDK